MIGSLTFFPRGTHTRLSSSLMVDWHLLCLRTGVAAWSGSVLPFSQHFSQWLELMTGMAAVQVLLLIAQVTLKHLHAEISNLVKVGATSTTPLHHKIQVQVCNFLHSYIHDVSRYSSVDKLMTILSAYTLFLRRVTDSAAQIKQSECTARG